MASYSDDFNRADGPLGADWVVTLPGGGETEIVSNAATGGYQCYCVWADPADGDDMFVELTQTNKTETWGPLACLPTASYVSSWGSHGYRLNTPTWRGEVGLVRNGSEVATADIGWSGLSAPFVWRIEREGAVVRVLLNGSEIIEWTDPSPLTGRYVGFSGQDPSTIIDDWSGGDLGPAGITGTISATTDAATSTMSGTVTAPSFTGTIAATTDAAVSTITGTATAPSFTGTISSTTDPSTSTIAGTATPPGVSGTIAATADAATAAISGSATVPQFTGTVTATTDDASASFTATYTPAPVTGTITATTDPSTAAFTGITAGPGAIDGSITAVTADSTGTITGSVTTPAVSGTLTAATAAATSTIVGTVTLPPGSYVVVASITGPAVSGPSATLTVTGPTAILEVTP